MTSSPADVLTTPAARSRWRRRLLLPAAGIALLAVVALLGLPRLADSDAVRRALERRISALAGGEVHYDSLSLSFVPSPRAELRNVTLRVEKSIDARMPALEIAIAPLALLAGEVRITALRATGPAITVQWAPDSGRSPPTADRAAIKDALAALGRDLHDASIEVTGARVEVVAAGERLLSITELALAATLSSRSIEATASGATDLWRKAQGRLRIAPDTLAASLQLEIQGLDAARALPAHGALAIRRGTVDARVDATTDGRGSVRGTLGATAPQLVVGRGERELDLGRVRLVLEASRDSEALAVSLRELELGNLVSGATGALRARPDGTAPAIELRVPTLDVARLNGAAAAIAGDIDSVRATAAILTGGRVGGLAVTLNAPDLSALADSTGLRVEAKVEAATVSVPAAGITARDVAGHLAVAGANLSATELAGRIGNGSFQAGTVALQLAPSVSLRELRAAVDVDLADALPVVHRLLGQKPHPVLSDIEALAGRATGSVAYDLERGRPRYEFDVATIVANARYRPLPFPLEVSAGVLRYANQRLAVRGVSGRVGRSQVNALTARFAFGARSELASASADLVVVLDEFYPWLAAQESVRPVLRGIDSATGTLAVQLIRAAGDLADPAALDVEVALAPAQVRIVAPALPGPLTLDGGKAALASRVLHLERLGAALLDSRVIASGNVRDFASASPHFDVSLVDAAAGDSGIEWIRARYQLPLHAVPRAPVRISGGQVDVTGSGRGPWSVRGGIELAAEAHAELDLAWGDGAFDLRRFALKDAWSDATVSLRRSEGAADVSFAGNFDNRTLQRVLLHPPTRDGAMRGDFRGVIDLDRPQRSTADGTLEAENVDLLERWGLPVIMERLRVEASGSALRVADSVLDVAGQRLALAGTIARREATYAVDGQVSGAHLDPAALLAAFAPAGAKDGPAPAAAAWKLPVEGRVRLSADSLMLGRHLVRSVAAVASLAPQRVALEVTEARFCGIRVPLTAVFTPRHAVVDGKASAKGEPLEPAASCLAGEPIGITGRFDLEGTFTAQGAPAALADAAQGSFHATAQAGRVQQLPVVGHIMALDAVAERSEAAAATASDAAREDSRIAIAGSFAGFRLQIDSATLDKPLLGIALSGEVSLAEQTVDLFGIAAPFSAATEALRHVPVLGAVLGARVVGIPLRVTGALRDPKVALLGAGAVSRGLVDLMGATLKAPVDLLDPLLGKGSGTP